MPMKYKVLLILLTPFLLALEYQHIESSTVQHDHQIRFLEPFDAIVKGESSIGDEILYFNVTYHEQTSSLYVINLDINNKKWSTHMAFSGDDLTDINVKSAGIVLAGSERSHLSLTAQKIYQALGGDEIKDTLASRLLIQMMTYWSQSPPNYKIIDRKLGG